MVGWSRADAVGHEDIADHRKHRLTALVFQNDFSRGDCRQLAYWALMIAKPLFSFLLLALTGLSGCNSGEAQAPLSKQAQATLDAAPEQVFKGVLAGQKDEALGAYYFTLASESPNQGTVTVYWPPYRVDLSLNLVLLCNNLLAV